MHESLKNDRFLLEKTLNKYCPVAIGTAFSTKFPLSANVPNSASQNISDIGLCRHSVTLNINFKS